MEEYLRRTQIFQKRLGTAPVPRKDARYLLFRMACPLMQSKISKFIDLNKVPKTFIHGNPHMDNYVRTFKGAAMMDFDRSRIGPYCWDIIRFLSSLSLRRSKFEGFLDRKVVENFIDGYITHFINPELPTKQVKMLKSVQPQKWQLTSRDYLKANKKWAKKMRDGALDPEDKVIQTLLKEYLVSRKEEDLLNEYDVDEVGLAPGSFGKKHYIYSLIPKNIDSHNDAIILDIKEVYEEQDNKFFYSPVNHHGLRMIEASKLYADGLEERLGFCTVNNKQYWGRQVPSFAAKVKKYLDKNEQADIAWSVASELGKGHRKGLIVPLEAEILEKDFKENFDHYFKISKYLTFELALAYESMRRKIKLDESFRNW